MKWAALVGLVAVVGWFGLNWDTDDARSADIHWRMIVTLDVDGERREFSNVYRTRFTRITQSLQGMGGSAEELG